MMRNANVVREVSAPRACTALAPQPPSSYAVSVQASPLRPILSWTTLFQLRVCACQVVTSQSVLVPGVSNVDLGGAQKTRQVVMQRPHSARLAPNRQQTKRICAYTVSDLLFRYVPVPYLQPASRRFADICAISLARRATSRQVPPRHARSRQVSVDVLRIDALQQVWLSKVHVW